MSQFGGYPIQNEFELINSSRYVLERLLCPKIHKCVEGYFAPLDPNRKRFGEDSRSGVLIFGNVVYEFKAKMFTRSNDPRGKYSIVLVRNLDSQEEFRRVVVTYSRFSAATEGDHITSIAHNKSTSLKYCREYFFSLENQLRQSLE